MKNIKRLALVLTFFVLKANAQTQTITYTPMANAGYEFKYGKFDSGLNIPNRDTTTGRGTRRGGSMVFYPNTKTFYGWDGVKWTSLGSGGSSGQFVDSITVNGANICQWKSGVPTCYIVNTGGGTFTGVDSLTYVGNSICWWKAGAPTCYSLIPGVDSVTVVGELLCQWVNGTPTCFTINGDVLGSGIDSVTVIGDQLCQWTAGTSICYTINNTSSGIDSITVVDTTMCTWSGGASTCFPIGHRTIVYVKDDLTVDSTTNPGFQTLGRYHSDGIVSGGIVTSAGCLLIHVSITSYILKQGTNFITGAIDLTVPTPDVSNPRTDRIVADTLGNVFIIPGTPAVLPQPPPYNLLSQVSIGTYPVAAGASCLGINSFIIYDETGGTEYTPTTANTITADPNNTANPEHLTVADYISSYEDSALMIFTKPSGQDTVFNNSIFRWGQYLLHPLTQQMQMQLFLGAVPVSNNIVANAYLSAQDTARYQTVGIPWAAFSSSGNIIFDKVVFTLRGSDISGAGGFYFDYFQLQTGLNNFSNGHGVLFYGLNATGDSTKLIRDDGVVFTAPKGSGGTVTNVATGYGLSGGPITTTGTIRVDSATLHLKFVAFTDTALMLAPYLRKIDTTGRFVNNVIKVTDSTIRVLKGATGTDLLIRGSGSGGNQNLLQVTGVDSLTTHNMIAGDTSLNYNWYRDSVFSKKNFASTTTGLKGALLRNFKTEKYNTTFDGIGVMGAWQEYLIRNYYNAGTRPGEIYSFGYNINSGGSAAISNEGAFAWTMESDFNRTFESYWTVVKADGSNYRPIFGRFWKDTSLSDLTMKTSVFHITPIDTAYDYLNVRNGHMILRRIINQPADVSTPIFEIVAANSKTIAMLNNGSSLLFGGGDSYVFDNEITVTNPSNQLATYIQQTRTTGASYGLDVEAKGAGGTLNVGGYFDAHNATSNYGVQIAFPGSGATNYAIYSNATAQSYFAGNVGIGDDSPLALFTVGASDLFQVASTGIIKSNKMLKATGTPTVVTHQTDSTLSQMTLTDLAAALGSGTGIAVDSIYRTPGKDSIQFSIATRYHAIKDSVGLTSVDTTNISNFSVKVRSLFSVTSPLTYNSGTGALAITAMDATHAGYVAAGTSANKILHGDGTWKDTTAVGAALNGTGIVSASGTSISYNTTSASIAGIISDETGSGAMVFGTSPAITTSLTTPSTTFSLANTTATTVNAFQAATTLNMGAASSTWNIGDNTTINGTGANADVTIQGTSSGTRASSYVIFQPNGGNVGIGTSTPSSLLHVAGNTNAALAMLFQNSNSGTNAYAGVQLQNNSASSYIYLTSSGYSTGGGLANELYVQNATGGGVQLYNGTMAYRISGGASGIGVASPTAALHIKAGTATASTAPLKFTSGVLLTTPEAQTIETDSTDHYWTSGTNSDLLRQRVATWGYKAITATYSVQANDRTLEATSGTFTATLPTAVGIAGRIYILTNTGAGVVTVGTTSSQTFANVLTTPTTLALSQFNTITVQSNGANWLRITNL